MISQIASLPMLPGTQSASVQQVPTANGTSFGQYLTNALGQVADLQAQADRSVELAGAGAGPDAHSIMIQMEKAKLAIDLTVQVRNKAVEAYQEIMRIQM